MLDFIYNKKLYDNILNGYNDKPVNILGGYPSEVLKIGNIDVNNIKIGDASIVKIAVGSITIYDSTS